jgi:hypothetical protein
MANKNILPKRYFAHIGITFGSLIIFYVIVFCVLLLPSLMSEGKPSENFDNIWIIYWKTVAFPIGAIFDDFPFRNIVFLILNLLIQSNIIYLMIRGIRLLIKRN